MTKTYTYESQNGDRTINFDWVDADGKESNRTVTNSNPNAFWFLIDALDKLGYVCIVKKHDGK